jgi:hypothetical protein
VSTGSDGKVTSKAESLASAIVSKYVSAEYEDVLATVFGNTAIATGVFKALGAPMRRESLWIFMSVGLIRGRKCPAVNGSVSRVINRQ